MATQKEILDFISQNSEDKLSEYFQKLCDKQKELNLRIDKLTIYFILTALVFFLLFFSSGTTVQLGPISISNNSIIYKLIPLFFAYIFLEFAVVTNHKADVMKLIKTIALNVYKQKINEDYFQDTQCVNFFTRILIPFSFWSDLINNLKNPRNVVLGCLSAMLLLPALIIFVLPFYFEFVSIKFLAMNYWQDLSSKFSVSISIWLMLIAIYFYFEVMTKNYIMLKKEGRLSIKI